MISNHRYFNFLYICNPSNFHNNNFNIYFNYNYFNYNYFNYNYFNYNYFNYNYFRGPSKRFDLF